VCVLGGADIVYIRFYMAPLKLGSEKKVEMVSSPERCKVIVYVLTLTSLPQPLKNIGTVQKVRCILKPVP
jgi:hypothetical protein